MDRFIALLFLSGFVAGRVIVDRTQQDSQSIRGAEYGGKQCIFSSKIVQHWRN